MQEVDPAVRGRLADEISQAITNKAFEVFVATDGQRSIRVHPEHEGLTLAAQIARETGGVGDRRSSADVLVHLESWLRVRYRQSRKSARETGEPTFDTSAAVFAEVLDKLSDIEGGR